MMNAGQLRTIILQNANPVALQTALDLLRTGNALTAVQSGTQAYSAIWTPGPPSFQSQLVSDPHVFFDGIYYTVFLFVTTGG